MITKVSFPFQCSFLEYINELITVEKFERTNINFSVIAFIQHYRKFMQGKFGTYLDLARIFKLE